MHLLGAAVAALCALFALAVWRLSAGPVSLAFLAPYVEQALAAEQSRYRLSFDDLVLTWAGWERTLDIRARGVRAIAAKGGALAGVPEIGVALSLPAMARGLIAPTRLDVFGAGVRIVRTADGRFDLGLDGQGGGRERGVTEELLHTFLLAPDPDGAAAYLHELNIVDSRVLIQDEKLGVEWTAPAARLAVERRPGGMIGAAILKLALADQLVDVTVEADYDADSGEAKVGLTFSDLRPKRLAGLAEELAPLARLDLPVGGHVDLVAGANGALREADFDLSGGAGRIDLADYLAEGSGLDVALVQARGHLGDAHGGLALDELYVDLGGPTASASARLSGDWRAPDLNGEVEIEGVPVDELGRYWPRHVADGARDWVGAHAAGGVVDRFTLRLAVAGADWHDGRLARDQVDARFAVSGTTVDYSAGLPPATGIAASGRFDGAALHADVGAGAIGPLAIGSATVDLLGYDTGPGRAEVQLDVTGSVPETLAALAETRLATVRLRALDASLFTGSGEGTITVALPMVHGLRDDAVRVSVGADLHGLGVAPGGLGGFVKTATVTGAEAALLLDTAGFDLTGEALVNGTHAGFYWHESFDRDPDVRRRVDVTARLDDDDPNRVDLSALKLSGPVDVELRINELRDGSRVGELDVGATDAALTLPVLDWHKPAGAQGSARFALEWGEAGIARVPRFGVLAEGLSAAGSARRDDTGMWTVTFDRLVAGLTDAHGEVRARPGGGLEVGVYGQSLDLRPYFAGREDDGEVSASSPPFALVANVDSVLVGDELMLRKVDARARFDGTHVTDAAFTCAVGRAEGVAFRLQDGGAGRRTFTIDASDAGAVFEALDVTRNMIGGALTVDGAIDDTRAGGPMTGTIRVTDFHMIDAPVLAKLLNVASITGALEMLKGDGIPFDRLEAPFAYATDVLTLKDAIANGLSIGLTLEGDIDLERDWIDLAGTIVPAYMLNTALGYIPVVGDILTGGEGKGVFAATFVAEGPRDEPLVVVNPLAVLAPGILRELIELAPSASVPAPGPQIGGRAAGPPAGPTSVPRPVTKP